MNQPFEKSMVIVASLVLFFTGCQSSLKSNRPETGPISLNSLKRYEVPLSVNAPASGQAETVKPLNPKAEGVVFRGQDGPNGYPKQPVPASRQNRIAFQDPGGTAGNGAPAVDGFPPVDGNQPLVPQTQTFGNTPPPPGYGPSGLPGQGQFGLGQPFITPPGIQNGNVADLDIFVREGQTGQFMIG
ncbi:MAG: hypothetical protein VX768_17175, partial [Planctomycetota bacterium]|nr:hypothetical protein [Planctomycetota bacterium]